MRTSFLITGLAGLVLAAPRPQNIDFKVVEVSLDTMTTHTDLTLPPERIEFH